MTALSHHDLQFILLRTPRSVLEAMQKQPGRVFMAGGFIRSVIAQEVVNDVDLFVPSQEDANTLAMTLAENDPRRIYKTDNAFTIKGHPVPLQIIFRWLFNTPQECCMSFDFTIGMSAVWWTGDKWDSACHQDFYADLAARRLVYTSPDRNEDAGGSMLRVLKFYQRGYRIPLSSMGAVISRMLRGVKQENWDKRNIMDPVQWEGLIGHVMTGLLKEVDPALDPAHIAHLPDPVSAPKEKPAAL